MEISQSKYLLEKKCVFYDIWKKNSKKMSKILSVENLTKKYTGKRTHVAVDQISFDLHEREILGFLGPNGSGKTTTIQMLLGTLSPTSGSIRYFGKEFRDYKSEILNSITYASSYHSLPWSLTVKENLKVFGYLYGLNPKESERLYFPLLERFGMLSNLSSKVSSLSAGQVTRLMLVKAFFTQPKLVLLDEPTASLDPEMAHEICEFILEERDRRGLSILFTSHKMEEASLLCDRILFLKNGKIIADDKPLHLAKSIKAFKIKLIIADGMKRIINLVQELQFQFIIEHRLIEITIDEEKIPDFLTKISNSNIVYSNIKIEEPSLEDYFLQMSRSK